MTRHPGRGSGEAGPDALPDVIALPDQSQPAKKRPAPWKGRKRVADPRTARFNVRCAPAFKAKIAAQAAEAGAESLSAFVCEELGDDRLIRRRRSTLPKPDRALLAKLLAQLGKIGSNHNQLAYEKNSGGGEPTRDDFARVEQDIQTMRRALLRALGYAD